MGEKIIWNIPYSQENYKCRMWSRKSLAREGQLGYDINLQGTMRTPAENEKENTKEDALLKQTKQERVQ